MRTPSHNVGDINFEWGINAGRNFFDSFSFVREMACAARTATCVSRRSTKRGLTTKIHAVCASEKFALKFHLSAGTCHDAPEGGKLIEMLSLKGGKY